MPEAVEEVKDWIKSFLPSHSFPKFVEEQEAISGAVFSYPAVVAGRLSLPLKK